MSFKENYLDIVLIETQPIFRQTIIYPINTYAAPNYKATEVNLKSEASMAKRDVTTFHLHTTIDLPVILEPHEFYISEARSRILGQFSDIDGEAKAIENKHLKVSEQSFNPEYDDSGDVYERAFQANVSHWMALTVMQNTVTLALTAGMYHQFDKTLREKIIKEFSHWSAVDWDVLKDIIWTLSLRRLLELLEWIGIKIKGNDFANKIHTCGLVVNVYKHGEGDAHTKLSVAHPEYYLGGNRIMSHDTRHDDLQVSQEQFVEFADAITAFWKNIPEYCSYSQLGPEPAWLKEVQKKSENRLKLLKPKHNQINSN